MAVARSPRKPIAENRQVGLNWQVQKAGEKEIVWHNGRTEGFVSFLGLDEKNQTAIVVLSNSSAENVDDIGLHMLEKAVDAQITFEVDAAGLATGAVLHQNGQDIPARRTG